MYCVNVKNNEDGSVTVLNNLGCFKSYSDAWNRACREQVAFDISNGVYGRDCCRAISYGVCEIKKAA
ncbi:MAG: hypothetical protein IJI14_17675 [Anaerolineaceae bacterium]|nr:hypothetical protein [Anaerolineaceae bacterium]